MRFYVKIAIIVINIILFKIILEKSIFRPNNDQKNKLHTEKIWSAMYSKNSLKQTNEPEKWNNTPSFSILTRLYSGSVMEFYNIFQMSYLLFWPYYQWTNSDLILVFDDENEQDHRMGTILANLPPFPKVFFEKKPKQQTFCSDFQREGYSRQQYSNFYSDMYTQYEHVGFTDSDSFFVTSITPESLFINGKPRISGYNGCCKPYIASLKEAIGGDIIGEFMIPTGLPIIVKSKHFSPMREHITKRMKAHSFEEAFYKLCSKYTGNRYSQFDLMIHYLWNFKRDEYSWHLNDYESSNHPDFTKRMTNNKMVLDKNIPITGVSKHSFHMKWPKPTFDLVYDFVCTASNLKAGDCGHFLNKQIVEKTQMSLFIDWTIRTKDWKKRKMPKETRKKMYENPWQIRNMGWNDTYQMHVKNLRRRNVLNKWRNFN